MTTQTPVLVLPRTAQPRNTSLPRLSSAASNITVMSTSSYPAKVTAVTAAAPTHALYQTFPARLAPAPMPTRVNPLNPPPPNYRTVALETQEPHLTNEKRAQWMKQREHYRYHNAWSKYYYGAPAEQESYKSYCRAVLKQQMSDKWSSDRNHRVNKVSESQEAIGRDIQERMDDMNNYRSHHNYLQTFRDDNKKLMEWQWANTQQTRRNQQVDEKEQLKYNPINWSKSLK